MESAYISLSRKSGMPMLIWGYITLAVTLAVYLCILFTHNYNWNWMWLALPVIGGIWTYFYESYKKSSNGEAKTILSQVINKIWIVIGFTALFISCVSLFGLLKAPILFTITLMMGIGFAIMGLILRFALSTWGGIISIINSPFMLLLNNNWEFLFFIVAFIVMAIIPGHIMN